MRRTLAFLTALLLASLADLGATGPTAWIYKGTLK
jgi:hypothetical protein